MKNKAGGWAHQMCQQEREEETMQKRHLASQTETEQEENYEYNWGKKARKAPSSEEQKIKIRERKITLYQNQKQIGILSKNPKQRKDDTHNCVRVEERQMALKTDPWKKNLNPFFLSCPFPVSSNNPMTIHWFNQEMFVWFCRNCRKTHSTMCCHNNWWTKSMRIR